MDRTIELPPCREPEQTERLLSPTQIVDKVTAKSLAVFFSTWAARGVEDLASATEVLTQRGRLEIDDTSIELDQEQIRTLVTPPGVDSPLLEELFANPPQILDALLNKISRLRTERHGKKRSEQSLQAERSLVNSVTMLSNLFVILYGDHTIENREGVWQ